MATQLRIYLGERLQAIREKKGLTQEDVAKRAGTERGYYAKLEQGYALPSLKLLEKILKVLDSHFRDVLP